MTYDHLGFHLLHRRLFRHSPEKNSTRLVIKMCDGLLDSSRSIERISAWFSRLPAPDGAAETDRRIADFFGQVVYFLELLSDAGSNIEHRKELAEAAQTIEQIRARFREVVPGSYVVLGDINRAQFIDALANQIVTSLGIAQSEKFNIGGALQEVANVNDALLDEPDAIRNPTYERQGYGISMPDYSKYV